MIPFSRRTAWDLRPNALAARLAERRAAGRPPAYDLSESNPTRVGLGLSDDELREALDIPGLARYEPDPQGARVAREAVAAAYAEQGRPVSPDALFLTASTSEAYAWLFKLLTDPGDTVLVPRPGYPLFEYLAGLEGAEVESWPMRYDGEWWPDLAQVEARLLDRTRPRVAAVVAVNPGNPTGAYLSVEESARLSALCAGAGAALISDEVFADYALEPDPRAGTPHARGESLLEVPPEALTFVLSGLSKVLALPQLKLGWIHVAGPQAAAAEAQHRLEVIADTWLSVAAPVQLAAPALFAKREAIQGAILTRLRRNLAALRATFPDGSKASVLAVEGGWHAVLRVPAAHSDEAWSLVLLDEDDVLVQPGFFFDFEAPGHLVLSLLPREADFLEAVRRVARRVARV